MDPLAMAGSAINILNKAKEQIKQCEEVMIEARDLNKAIETFEVILMMIPSRGGDDMVEFKPRKKKNLDILDGGNNNANMIKEVAKGAAKVTENYLMDKAADIIDKTPLGQIVSLFQIGKDLESIKSDGPPPAETLKAMKEEKVNGIRIYSDLDVMFAGMAFVIKSALDSMSGAAGTLQQMHELGVPNMFWLCMPWKSQTMLKLQEDLGSHKGNLVKAVATLQSAIGVASYAVQLEQLESVLDATNAFQHKDMKQMWKRKIGSDKTKVLMQEFCEAFLATLEEEIMSRRKNRYMDEKIGRSRVTHEVGISRFLNELFNSNNDDYLTVYELSAGLLKLVPDITQRAVNVTLDYCMVRDVELLTCINFKFVIHIDPGSDMMVGTVDDKVTIAKRGEPILIRPFHRALIIAELPLMDDEVYQYDHLVMLQYNCDPRVVAKSADKSYKLSRVKHSPCFVLEEINGDVIGEGDGSAWNAFRSVRMETGQKCIPPSFNSHKNFERFEVAMAPPETENQLSAVPLTSEQKKSQAEQSGEKQDMVRILYSPYFLDSGFYSPRYCLDTYEMGGDGWVNEKKAAKMPKSYLRGNLKQLLEAQGETATVNKFRRSSVGKESPMAERLSASAVSSKGPKQTKKKSVTDALGKPKRRESTTGKYGLPEVLGPIIRCTDDLEIVFAEPADGGDEVDSDDEDQVSKMKVLYRPRFFNYYPFLPNRKLILNEPDDFSLFVNVSDPKKGKEKEGVPKTEETKKEITSIGLFDVQSKRCIAEFPLDKIRVQSQRHLYKIDLRDLRKDDLTDRMVVGFVTKGEGVRPKTALLPNTPVVEIELNADYQGDVDFYDSDMYDSDETSYDGDGYDQQYQGLVSHNPIDWGEDEEEKEEEENEEEGEEQGYGVASESGGAVTAEGIEMGFNPLHKEQ